LLKGLSSVFTLSTCTGSAVSFLRLWVPKKRKIEASFCAAIRIAKEQKSVSLQKRAEATYTEYRRQKASGQEDVDSGYRFDNAECGL
jgi:hypothetical protein